MKYYVSNGIKIIECAPSEFKVVMVNQYKKNVRKSTFVNANFFAGRQKLNNEVFTLPVNHLICDYEASGNSERIRNEQRGTFKGNKYYYDSYSYGAPTDQFYHKTLTVLAIKNKKPSIFDMAVLDKSYEYLVAGIPVMKNGQDVKWKTYVSKQGWTGGELYGTYHIFAGLKNGTDTIYLMSWKTTSSNLIYSGEAFRKFSAMGFRDVIKLDGGGSEIMKYNNVIKHATAENRQISAIIEVVGKEAATTPNKTQSKTNPYAVPTKALKRGSTGNGVRWMQFQLNKAGFACSIDGSFGPATEKTLKSYQSARGLEVDGSCGPATRAALKKE